MAYPIAVCIKFHSVRQYNGVWVKSMKRPMEIMKEMRSKSIENHNLMHNMYFSGN